MRQLSAAAMGSVSSGNSSGRLLPRKPAANQENSDKAEQGKSTDARHWKRAGIRERAKTGIQPQAPARPI